MKDMNKEEQMILNIKIKKCTVLITGGTDIITMLIDGNSPYPNLGYDGDIKIECQKGYGDEYCKTVLGIIPDIIDVTPKI